MIYRSSKKNRVQRWAPRSNRQNSNRVKVQEGGSEIPSRLDPKRLMKFELDPMEQMYGM